MSQRLIISTCTIIQLSSFCLMNLLVKVTLFLSFSLIHPLAFTSLSISKSFSRWRWQFTRIVIAVRWFIVETRLAVPPIAHILRQSSAADDHTTGGEAFSVGFASETTSTCN